MKTNAFGYAAIYKHVKIFLNKALIHRQILFIVCNDVYIPAARNILSFDLALSASFLGEIAANLFLIGIQQQLVSVEMNNLKFSPRVSYG